MAEPRQKLVDGISRVCQLRTNPTSNETVQDEAWAAVKNGIVVARRDEEALDSHSAEEMKTVLEFLIQRGIKRKASKGQVNECLKILLGRVPWLQVAQRDEELRAALREALAGSPEALERLEDSSLVAAERGRTSSKPEPAPADPEKPVTIKQQLDTGSSVMRKFGWEFPHDPLGTKLDEATAGFQSFFEGITALTTTTGRASVGPELSAVFADLQEDWANILQFLLSMYNSGVRTTYTSRIRFVVINLRSFSTAFRALMPWRSLPWGQEPLPPEEAKEEEERRKAAEEEEDRRHREEEDLRLAPTLQEEEETQVRAEEAQRKQRLEEDWRLARNLHETMNVVSPQPQRRPGGIGVRAR